MRGLVREAGLEHQFEIDSAGTGSWHTGDPPDRRATEAARARGVTLEGAARQVASARLRALRPAAGDGPREPARAADASPPDNDAAGKARLLRSFDPAAAGAPDLDVPDPYYGGPDGFETVLDQVEAACRGLLDRCGEPGGGGPGGDRPRRCGAWSGSAAATSTRPTACSSRTSRSAFVKTRADVAPGEYEAEAAALRWLGRAGRAARAGGARRGRAVLVLDWVDEGGRGDDAAFGAGLAEVHAAGADDGARRRGAGARARRARARRGRRPDAAAPRVVGAPERRRARLADVLRRAAAAPAAAPRGPHALRQPGRRERLRAHPRPGRAARAPARLHGDLWSGNAVGARREGVADRPAAYGGHREVDLAMLRLFGSPGPRFLAAYEERHPLAPGHEERVELYQLFPLLVHAALFGGGYPASAERVARKYASRAGRRRRS